MSILNSILAAGMKALFSGATSIAQKLIYLKLYSQIAGSAAAQSLAASDSTIGAYAASIVNGLNATSVDAALKAALDVSGITEDQAVSIAQTSIEGLVEKALTATGVNSVVLSLIESIAEPEIQNLLRAEYEKLEGTGNGASTTTNTAAAAA